MTENQNIKTQPLFGGIEKMGVYFDTKMKKWIAQIHTGERYLDGRRKYRKTSAKTKKEAMAKERELFLEIEGINQALKKLIPEEKTCSELFEKIASQWLLEKKSELARSTWDRYFRIVNGHLIPKFGKNVIDGIREDEIRDHIDTRRSDSDRRQHFFILRMIFEKVELDTMQKIPTPKMAKKEINCITDIAELGMLVDGMKNSIYYVPTVILAATGMRVSELLGLKWSDVHFEKRKINISRSLHWTEENGKKIWYFGELKNKYSYRTITINKKTIEILKNAKENQKVQNNDLICLGIDGQPMKRNNLTRALKEKAKQLGIKKEVNGKSLRHTHATILIMVRKMKTKTVSRRLGHSSVAITLDVYSQYLPEQDEDCADIMDEIFLENDDD